MKWKYKVLGGHTHVDVFMNGANCGHLCFRNEEFQQLRYITAIEFVEDVRQPAPQEDKP